MAFPSSTIPQLAAVLLSLTLYMNLVVADILCSNPTDSAFSFLVYDPVSNSSKPPTTNSGRFQAGPVLSAPDVELSIHTQETFCGLPPGTKSETSIAWTVADVDESTAETFTNLDTGAVPPVADYCPDLTALTLTFNASASESVKNVTGLVTVGNSSLAAKSITIPVTGAWSPADAYMGSSVLWTGCAAAFY